MQDLDSEFPFPLSAPPDPITDVPDLKSQDLTFLIQNLTSLARRHLENLSVLSDVANQQVLLKQFTRENLEEQVIKTDNSKRTSRDNALRCIGLLVDERARDAHGDRDRVRQWVREEVITRIEGLEIGKEEADVIETMIDKAVAKVGPTQSPPLVYSKPEMARNS